MGGQSGEQPAGVGPDASRHPAAELLDRHEHEGRPGPLMALPSLPSGTPTGNASGACPSRT